MMRSSAFRRGEGTWAEVSRSIAAFRACRSRTSLFHHRFQCIAGSCHPRYNCRRQAGFQMTVEQQVLEKLRELPPDKQVEVLAFVSQLQERSGNGRRLSLLGLWSNLDVKVSAEDIAEARREMWGSFPRDVS